MKRKKQFILLGAATLAVLAAIAYYLLRPNVFLIHVDAENFPHSVILKNGTFGFSEHGESLRCSSNLVDFDLKLKDGDQLENFSMILRIEPAQYLDVPGRPAYYPLTKKTVYNDLDGDSVLDTMVKIGPKFQETYILSNNTWIQGENSRVLWKFRKKVRAVNTGETYIFDNGGWKLSKD